MATERQIAANRVNAAKSTGPVSPGGKRISSQNASLRGLLSRPVVLKGEALRRYNAFAAALILQFQPRDSTEIALIQTMPLARWRILCTREIQTADFRREIASARRDHPSGASQATLAAIAFRSLAEDSRSFARQHRLEPAPGRLGPSSNQKLTEVAPSQAPLCGRIS
jgi:hypothetical protein